MKFTDFTGLYSLSKTLRFELKPIGKTLENIKKAGLLEQDQHRADSYKKVKKIIDEYHKAFIEKSLSNFELKYQSEDKLDSLEEYLMYYSMKRIEKTEKDKFAKIQDNLRKQIADHLKGDESYKTIFSKDLIRKNLPDFVKSDEERTLIKEFKDFTTYFKGFYENRENMYSAEDKSTAISHRIIHENLPKFVDNINAFSKIILIPELREKLNQIYQDFEEYLNVESIDEIFHLDYFSMVMTQKQIEVYNAIIGGKSTNDKKIQGLNEYINLYNQKHKDCKLPKLKLLFKQILSDRIAISWLPDNFKDDQEALDSIDTCYKNLLNDGNVLGEGNLKLLLENIDTYNLKGIFIRNDLQLTDISQKMYASWNVIQDAVILDLKKQVSRKKKESAEDYNDRLKKLYTSQESFSIQYLNDCLRAYGKTENIQDYFAKLGAVNNEHEQTINLFAQVKNAYTSVQAILTTPYPENANLAQDKETVALIKNLLDSLKRLQRFIKPLLGKGDESDKDERFYGDFTPLWETLNQITPLYNMVRNYMTRKPYSQEKIKLNFENSTLLGGWDLNKEHDNTAIILRKNGLYYLAIMKKSANKIFDKDKLDNSGDCYEKMVYKLLPGANKMLPKVFFSKSRIDEFKPSENIIENYKKGTHKKGANFNLADCHNLIDFFKSSISKHEDWSKFNFHFSDTSSYEDLSDFYREVEQQGYSISFCDVSVEYINKMVEKGDLYLFQIYNKDFSEFSKGTPNMHTLYWNSLFSKENLNNIIYKLNGQAEIFFRKKSLNYKRPTHPAHQAIKNKNKCNEKKESIFDYDLVKDKRYTVDKFQFHVPITMNFKSTGNTNINQQVVDYLRTEDDTHIIGIDRGERHLLYLVVIDSHGKIVEQFTLNEIVNEYGGNIYRTNYHDLLDTREQNREKARESWQTIENIKELKEGYISQVIHKITDLMQKYHAVVVLEDLNMGFMRGRQKVEKQVYQKFEEMLINKLNYLVNKKADQNSAGGLLHAYQLTSKFESFQKLGKQSGFLFYIPAWNTSKIDPVTGFVNLFDTRYESIDKAKAFFGKFDSIRYNADKDWFEFAFDYNNFTTKAEGTRTNWTICTYGSRIRTFRNQAKNSQWDNEEIDLTKAYKAFFAKHGINIYDNLKEAIAMETEKSFFEDLLHLLKLTLQMRNSITGTTTDYLISPVHDSKGNFYDSRICDNSLPANADANGAYNIARKGLMLIQQIKDSTSSDRFKFSPITNKDWLVFAQEKPYLND
jgi:CRISPR-associated protein Cpf1